MIEKKLNGYSKITKRLIEKTGFSVVEIQNKGQEKAFSFLKTQGATDEEVVTFIKEIFIRRLAYQDIMVLIQSCCRSHDN
jgi:hypothetical protein